MTTSRARKHATAARSLRDNGRFGEAGEYFTVAAYNQLGTSPPGRFGGNTSRALYFLLHSIVCYRMAGQTNLATTRGRQGRLLAEEMKERVTSSPKPANAYDQARRGVWDEFAGDFHVVVGDTENADPSYESAKSEYSVAEGTFDIGFAEQEHLNSIQFFEDLKSAAGDDLDDWYSEKEKMEFTSWIDHKRQLLPRYVDSVIHKEVY